MSSRPPPSGKAQRDVRLLAALALLVGVAGLAVPLFIWGHGRKRHEAPAPSASASASVVEPVASAPVVSFGDAGPAVAMSAGGRTVTFNEPRYLKCQDPGPTKTPPERCDHLGAIEEIVTRALVERATVCMPPLTATQSLVFRVDVSFKRRKLHLLSPKDGGSLPTATRKKLLACIEHGLPTPAYDTITHAHQRYLFELAATFNPATAPVASATVPPPPVGQPIPLAGQ